MSEVGFRITEDQGRALNAIQRGRRNLILNGHAGTGKTTLLWMVCQEMGDSIILAPTGKAARRVSEATGLPAKTMHSWLYRPLVDTKTWEVTYAKKTRDDPDYAMLPSSRMVLVDEASMVTRELWQDLRGICGELGLRIVLIGDDFQLPPVQGKDTFSVFTAGIGEQIKLTHVVRQALESSVLRAANAMREGRVDDALSCLHHVREDNIRDFAPPTGAGIVLCHRNETRNVLNDRVRGIYGFGGAVQEGEPIVVNKNNHHLDWLNGDSFPFGRIVEGPSEQRLTYKTGYGESEKEESGRLTYICVDMNGQRVIVCGEELIGTTPKDIRPGFIQYGSVAWAFNRKLTMWASVKGEEVEAPLPFVHANLGWTLTCHKAQGSQWDVVMVVLEPTVKLDEEEGRKWFYTSITRAVKSAVIVPVGWRLRNW